MHYDVLIPAGVPFSMLLVPEYWTDVGSQLRRFFTVRAIAEDNTFDATLTVTNDPAPKPGFSSLPYVKMRVLYRWDPSMDEDIAEVREAIADATSHGFKVSFAPRHRYRVEDPTGAIVAKDLGSRGEAESWMAVYLEARAGRTEAVA